MYYTLKIIIFRGRFGRGGREAAPGMYDRSGGHEVILEDDGQGGLRPPRRRRDDWDNGGGESNSDSR